MAAANLCKIHWVKPSPTIEKQTFERVKGSSILQAGFYLRVMRDLKAFSVRSAHIEVNGLKAGFFSVLEKKALGGLLHVVVLDRGPLWFEGYGSLSDFETFLDAFMAAFPARPGRMVRILPEMPDSADLKAVLQAKKFKLQSEPYQSILIDLSQPVEDLRAGLKKNWRGSLQKAEKSGLGVDWDMDGRYLDWLMKFYGFDKRTKGYDGPDVAFIKAISAEAAKDGALFIGRAMKDGKAIAAIIVLAHGQGNRRIATYQIGWNSQSGRELGAHNFLLWQAVLHLKGSGFRHFDLGGINEGDAINVKKFKDGMGGQAYCLPGLYTRKFF